MKKMKSRSLLPWFFVLALLPIAACGGDGDGDACKGVSCSGQGTCIEVDGDPVCQCNIGFHADGIECKPDACRPFDCVFGYCKDPANSPECVCNEGYVGDSCNQCDEGYVLDGVRCVLAGGCEADSCGNHGTCREDGPGFVCDCHQGWAGNKCDRCAEGYVGDNCDQCDEGYVLDGTKCVLAGNCEADSCGNNGTCREEGPGFVCDCDKGWAGNRCDRCAEGYVGDDCQPAVTGDPCDPDPCINATKCEAVGDEAVCTCMEGYAGKLCNECDEGYKPDGDNCVVDIENNPCVPNPCPDRHPGGNRDKCKVQEGQAVCQCNDGYHLDGDTCVEDEVVDRCTPNPCDVEPDRNVCKNVGGSFECECNPGLADQAGVCVAPCDFNDTACTKAHNSFPWIVSANGHGSVVLNLDDRALPLGPDRSNYRYALNVHPYQTWGLNGEGKDVNTRDVLWDTYMGLRVDGVGEWLYGKVREYVGYYGQDGIPFWVNTIGDLRVENFVYAPWQLSRPSLVMLAKVTNNGTQPHAVSIYSLHNYHIGYTQNDSHRFPDAADESIFYDGDSKVLIEQGPGGALVYYPLAKDFRYTADQGGGEADPYSLLNSGQDLGNQSMNIKGQDRVAGFQAPEVTLQPGESTWFGVVTAFEPNKDAYHGAVNDVASQYSHRNAAQALQEARDEWEAWRKPAPANLTAAELQVYRTSEAVLRMGQAWETTDRSKGQILASLPPGMWSISWVRDMAYAVVGLVRSGHFTEAKAALEFQLLAESGNYVTFEHNGVQQTGVGHDYQISVCRYYGNGKEESDWDYNGPNVEFDGFGLFLWSLGEYVKASGDTSIVQDYWDTIKDKIADVLVKLIMPNGMIAADSSIWELHWNGQQKQYTYTSVTAAKGLCEASQLALGLGKIEDSDSWANATHTITAGIKNTVVTNNFLAQSVEELANNSGYVDASVIEAFRWGLFDPAGIIAKTTIQGLLDELTVPNGIGIARNDDGGSYDSAEWVFMDLRMAGALRNSGVTANQEKADLLIDWITAQAINNMGLISELHTREGSNYDGSPPMVGFGAGAYIMELWHRENGAAPTAPCRIRW